MMYVHLRASDRVRLAIPGFQRFLNLNGLKVVEQREDSLQETIKLSINARIYGAKQCASNLIQSFFEGSIIEIDRGDESQQTTFNRPKSLRALTDEDTVTQLKPPAKQIRSEDDTVTQFKPRSRD